MPPCRRCTHAVQSDIIPWKRCSRMHELAACARVRGPRGNRANPIRRASGTNGGSMFYRYCSRRGTDTSRVGRRAYIVRAFSRLPEDLWISVCLSLSSPRPDVLLFVVRRGMLFLRGCSFRTVNAFLFVYHSYK